MPEYNFYLQIFHRGIKVSKIDCSSLSLDPDLPSDPLPYGCCANLWLIIETTVLSAHHLILHISRLSIVGSYNVF